jgi:cytochrome P450
MFAVRMFKPWNKWPHGAHKRFCVVLQEPSLDDLPCYPFVAAVVKEALRLFPPAHTTNRECVAAAGCTLTGAAGQQYHIPCGTWVHINIWGMHRSAKYWKEPTAFRPDRFLEGSEEAAARHPNAYMPFGIGPRMCIGWRFAMQEVQMVLIR